MSPRSRVLPSALTRVLSRLLALSMTVAALTVAAQATTTTTAHAAPVEITDGSFVWGVKGSWRRYIGPPNETTGGGSTSGDGATVEGTEPVANGQLLPVAWRFTVESGTYDAATATTTLDLAGYVHFRAWYGQVSPGKWALDTKFSDLSIEISEDAQVLRGTHTGYTREDPGGDLHVDEDVVLARFDVAGAQTSFGPPTTTYDAVPTTAGPGLSIYGEGTTLDNASFSYDGAGSLPDLAERFDAPGVPVLEQGPTYSLGRGQLSQSLQQVLPSGDGKRLFVFNQERNGNNYKPLVVTAVGTSTMAAVGTAYSHPLPPGTQLTRFAIDPGTDTLFFTVQHEGTPVAGNAADWGVENTVHSLTFDGTSFTHEVV